MKTYHSEEEALASGDKNYIIENPVPMYKELTVENGKMVGVGDPVYHPASPPVYSETITAKVRDGSMKIKLEDARKIAITIPDGKWVVTIEDEFLVITKQ